MTTLAQTAQQKRRFLEAFAASGVVLAAAKAAGCDRRAVYRWLEHDERFALAYRQAELDALDVLVSAAVRRAVQGVPHERRIYDRQGALIDTETETRYSDNLLMFLIKKRDPSYRENRFALEHSGPGGAPIRTETKAVDDLDWDALAAEFVAARGGAGGDDAPEGGG